MGGTSFQFLGFALVVVLIYNLGGTLFWRTAVLLVANLAFLASFRLGSWSYLPFAAFLLLGYAGLMWIRRSPKYAFPPVLFATIAAFVWLKKYTFVPGSAYLPFSYVTIGLSYILFRLLHLMIDARNDALPARVSLLYYANYTLNFTTLVSGPIQRYQEFAKMQAGAAAHRLSLSGAASAGERMVGGFFKANVLALAASSVQARAIEALLGPQPAGWKVLYGVVVIVAYPLFLYCNFSGYIDVVIGLGQLLGFTLPENFNRPLVSDNFINFWSRWHITLSNWLKDYVYNPLLMALMRRFPSAALETVWLALALFVTFFLVGVWHGQTSEFVFFGFLQGLGVSVNRVYQVAMTRRLGRKGYKALSANGLYMAVSRGLTFTWFAFTTIWFWSNRQQIGAMRAALAGGTGVAVWMVIIAGSTVVLAAWEAARGRVLALECEGIPVVHSQYWRIACGTALLVVILAAGLLLNQAAPGVVYKEF